MKQIFNKENGYAFTFWDFEFDDNAAAMTKQR